VPPVKALITATLAAGAAYAGTQLAINAVEAAQTAPATAPAQSASSAGNSVIQTYAASRVNSPKPPAPVSIGGSTPASPPPGNHDDQNNIRKQIRSLEKQLAQHQKKLNDYMRNPNAFDNKGFLKNAQNQQTKDNIIGGRAKHLQNEINSFQRQIDILQGRLR